MYVKKQAVDCQNLVKRKKRRKKFGKVTPVRGASKTLGETLICSVDDLLI